MPTYFLIVASKDHVENGVKGGFAQAGHGREDYASKLAKGDWIVYYSAKDTLENGKPYRKFTALGQITDDEPYQPNDDGSFRPYRRNADYQVCHEADIYPLINDLEFIKNKQRWGFYLVGGFRELSKHDFDVIKRGMQ